MESLRGYDRWLDPPEECLPCADGGDCGDCGCLCHMSPRKRREFAAAMAAGEIG